MSLIDNMRLKGYAFQKDASSDHELNGFQYPFLEIRKPKEKTFHRLYHHERFGLPVNNGQDGTEMVSGEQIYRAFYADGKSDRAWAMMNCRYSERSFSCLEAEKTQLHYISATRSPDKLSLVLEHSAFFLLDHNLGAGEIGRVASTDKWCFRYEQSVSGKPVYFTYYFSQKPSFQVTQKAIMLERLIQMLGTAEVPETYTCFRCGDKHFWLDNGGKDLYECAKLAQSHSCSGSKQKYVNGR